ncbi:hypothetical protein [Microbispora oryzae]|uniref:hypothetical protein n=1 Tax=Microbispora oryzae TaxID=2806554 RepID=UPI001AEC1D95|nr:hypothetical protein [Microbispora oryzae]
MGRVTQVAIAGAVLAGAVGCSASAETGAGASPTITLTPGLPTPVVSVSRQDIHVEVDPAKVTGGATRTVHVTARCPLSQGGPEYRATARSDAFTGLVTLVPRQGGGATPTPAVPEVTGGATIRADAKPGGYRVQVRCEATNDVGSAGFRIVAAGSAHTGFPTRAPHAGGGGTAAGGPEDKGGLPTGVAFVAFLAAVGAGVAVVRRRSGA